VVTEVVEIHDYVQLVFSDDIRISIYNEMTVSPPSIAVSRLVGRIVTAVAEDDNAIEIQFLDGARIKVDMRAQAYRGPEALQLNRRGHPDVIWN
jgi:hypothetical protein